MLLTDTFMCSDTCPCPMDAQTKYTEFYQEVEGKKRFEEAKRYMDGDATAAAKEGFSKLVFASADTYTKYSDCYEKKLDKQLADDQNGKYKQAYDEFKQDGLAYFQQMEGEFNCGGICEPSLFYVDLEVTKGPPTIACISAIISEDNY